MSEASRNDSSDNIHIPDEVTRLNADISNQNDRFANATGEKYPHQEILSMVKRGIADEQIDTFQELLEKTRGINFEGLAKDSLAAHEALRSQEEIDEALQQEIESALGDAPRKAEEILDVGEKIRLEETAARQHGLQEKADSADSELERLGVAWEIPKALSPDERMLLSDMVMEPQFGIIDIIPLTPAEKESLVAAVERTKHSIDAPNASDFITEYFKEESGKVVTVEQLIRLLYVADVEDVDYRSRVTTLLGPKRNGRIIDSRLQESNLELQYGWRMLVEKTSQGLVQRSRTRIYRSVEAGSTDHEDVDMTIELGTEKPNFMIRDVIKNVRQDSEDGKASKDTQQNDSDSLHGQDANEQHPSQAADEEESGSESVREWELKFRAEVERVVVQMQEDQIFEKDYMDGGSIRAQSSIDIGTRTAKNKLAESGLMSSKDAKHDGMTREQRVLSALLNSQQVLRSANGRKNFNRARAIVREVIDSHLATQK